MEGILEQKPILIHADDYVTSATRQLITPEAAMSQRNTIREGEYISLRNRNNLAEELIYQRNSFDTSALGIPAWDGVSKDTAWYDTDPEANVFYISSAKELAGLDDIVAKGINFSKKIIRLMNHINLGGHQWNPLGRRDTESGVFSGTFDGNGYAIYNLKIDEINPRMQSETATAFDGSAFFDHLVDAIIKSLIFENATIIDKNNVQCSAVVSVHAARTIFSGLIINGRVAGINCASITVKAIDSTFDGCVNRAKLQVYSTEDDQDIVCGGFVAKIHLSDEVRGTSDGKAVMCFHKCTQAGKITADVKHNLKRLSLGQLYGFFYDAMKFHENQVSILIDRCSIGNTNIYNAGNYVIGSRSYYASVNGNVYASSGYNREGFKHDLLEGLIGQTPSSVAVTVIKPTASVTVNNMVIPGSINTLYSKQHAKNFMTTKSEMTTDVDGIVDMSPYYRFVTTATT